MLTGAAAGVLKLIWLVPFCNDNCVAFTVAGLPSIAEDCSIWLACVSWISCVRFVLVAICCSTLENCTSSEVNWDASTGWVGSWWRSCVISMVRKLLKLADRPLSPAVPVWLMEEPDVVEALAVAAVVVIAKRSF